MSTSASRGRESPQVAWHEARVADARLALERRAQPRLRRSSWHLIAATVLLALLATSSVWSTGSTTALLASEVVLALLVTLNVWVSGREADAYDAMTGRSWPRGARVTLVPDLWLTEPPRPGSVDPTDPPYTRFLHRVRASEVEVVYLLGDPDPAVDAGPDWCPTILERSATWRLWCAGVNLAIQDWRGRGTTRGPRDLQTWLVVADLTLPRQRLSLDLAVAQLELRLCEVRESGISEVL